MLKDISTILEYKEFIKLQKPSLDKSDLKHLDSKIYKSALHKLNKFDANLALEVIESCYVLIDNFLYIQIIFEK